MATLADTVTGNATGVLAPYGLLSPAVKVIEDNSPHWQNGIQYETLGCSGTTSVHSICVSASASINEASGEPYRSYKPFEVRTTFSCSTRSRTAEELEDMARNELDIIVQKAIEREFLTGTLAEAENTASGEGTNRYLSDSEAVSVTSAPVKLKQALAMLEDAIAYTGNGAQGLLHVPRSVASVDGLKPDGNGVLRSNIDTPVVAGVGYSPAPGETEVTIYATGPVTVRLGEIVVIPEEKSQAIDRKVNTTTYTATRSVAVTWDSCVHFSAQVDLTLDY
jgi:hypothetical protein